MKISSEIKKEFDILLKEIVKALSNGIKGAKNEIPKMAHEILLYNGILGNIFNILACVLILSFSCVLSYYIHNHHLDSEFWGVYVISALIVLAMLSLIPIFVFNLLKAKYAPRLFLLEYAKSLMDDK